MMPTTVTLDRDITDDRPFPSWVETESLELMPLYQVRASAVYRLFTSFDAVLPASIEITTMGDAFDLLEHATHAWYQQQAAFYIVRSRETGSDLGIVGLQNIDWDTRTFELTVELAPAEYDAFRLRELVYAACYVAFDLYDFTAISHAVRVGNEEGETAFSAIREALDVTVERTETAIIIDGRGVEARRYRISKTAYDVFRGDERREE